MRHVDGRGRGDIDTDIGTPQQIGREQPLGVRREGHDWGAAAQRPKKLLVVSDLVDRTPSAVGFSHFEDGEHLVTGPPATPEVVVMTIVIVTTIVTTMVAVIA